LGIEFVVFLVIGISEDVVMLLVDDKGVEFIVVVGIYVILVEFFDKGWFGMVSIFLMWLWVGGKLIDVKGVNCFYWFWIFSW